MTRRRARLLLLGALAALYLILACFQLGLPGLHYDEAAEAGVNAMELVTGAPVTAFRGATITLFSRQLPLMVQDYIGALNVYLAAPVLAWTGIGVPNLRTVAVLTGLAALLLLERTVSEWRLLQAEAAGRPAERAPDAPISWAGVIAVALLAASPSFIFWSRQGVFVTNLTEPFCFWALWQGLRWLRTGQKLALLASAFASGLALYAKLLAFWVIAPFALLAGIHWLLQRQAPNRRAKLSPALCLGAFGAFLLPLLPVLIFNWQTGGTLTRIAGGLGQSYYGVDNLALLPNALVRGRQLIQVLAGDHFWYLGGLYGNALAPWLGAFAILGGLQRRWRLLAAPVLLLLLALFCSLFTVSDLFVTHYALIQPLAVGVIAIGIAGLIEDAPPRQGAAQTRGWRSWVRVWLPIGAVLLWLALDLTATLRYHRALAQSGGLGDHSDATYHLAYYLRYNGLGAPISLDWGFAAPVRFLSEGAVQPIEIFGYDDLAAPDAAFTVRLAPFLDNPQNVYLLHAAGATVFKGRREAFFAASQARGQPLELVQRFSQRDGVVLYELWRAKPPMKSGK